MSGLLKWSLTLKGIAVHGFTNNGKSLDACRLGLQNVLVPPRSSNSLVPLNEKPVASCANRQREMNMKCRHDYNEFFTISEVHLQKNIYFICHLG